MIPQAYGAFAVLKMLERDQVCLESVTAIRVEVLAGS